MIDLCLKKYVKKLCQISYFIKFNEYFIFKRNIFLTIIIIFFETKSNIMR